MNILFRALSVLASWGIKYLRVYRIVLLKPAEALVFASLTLLVGALGLWLPPVIAWKYEHPPGPEFVKALAEGAGYLFGLSTVATAMTFLVKEYLGSRESDFKIVKITGGVVAGSLVLIMSLFLGTQITAHLLAPTKDAAESIFGLQTLLTGLAFLVALYLFCLEQIDEYPEEAAQLKDRKKETLQRAIQDAQDPDLKV